MTELKALEDAVSNIRALPPTTNTWIVADAFHILDRDPRMATVIGRVGRAKPAKR